MERDALTAGVEPGGLNNYRQIKVLCCYILDNIGTPIKYDKLPEILQYEQLANFFEVVQALSELEKRGNIENKDGFLYLTEQGRQISKEMSFTLPYTVKEKSVEAALRLLAAIKIREENNVEITEKDGVYNIVCTMYDGKEVLMSLTFNVKSKLLAEAIRDNFYANPFTIYSGNIEMLTKNLLEKQ